MSLKPLAWILLSTFALSLAQGCSTYVAHTAPRRPDDPYIYRGTCYDAHLLRTAVAPKEKDETRNDVELRSLILLFIPLDLPLSFVAATLMLPYDATTNR
jgi:uncharacterized protein YceK